ncbi:MAG: universal stress protein [Cyanobacteriota bacterium ELA615]|jgi:hypothetical protein
MFRKILYTDSGASHIQEMLKVLLELPSIKQANITILHAVPPQVSAEGFAAKWEEGSKSLNQILKDVVIDPSKVSTVLRQGDPKQVVCDVAEEIHADLIIIGSRGLKRLEAILENSVSQYVFQLSTRPMLLVKDDIYIKKIKKVMVAIDKSPASLYALDLALNLLRGQSGVEIYLVRVNPDLKADIVLSRSEMEENPILGPALSKVKQMGFTGKAIVTGGRPGEQICKLVEDNQIDLLFLGSPDRRPSIAKSLPDLDRLLGTSLSDYVRVNAQCPVLLARQEG